MKKGKESIYLHSLIFTLYVDSYFLKKTTLIPMSTYAYNRSILEKYNKSEPHKETSTQIYVTQVLLE